MKETVQMVKDFADGLSESLSAGEDSDLSVGQTSLEWAVMQYNKLQSKSNNVDDHREELINLFQSYFNMGVLSMAASNQFGDNG